MKRLSRWRRFLLAFPLLLILLFGGYLAWANVQNAPLPTAEAALESDETVVVETDPWLVFRPTRASPCTGFIIYPGGLVPPAAYAPVAREIATEGYLLVVVPMPLNLAVTASERALDVIAAYPEIESWTIGGHSLGGAMAARFAFANPETVEGLVLWAGYPAESNRLASYNLEVVSIYGSEDGLSTPLEVAASAALLPAETRFVEIRGGNHTQFGHYGDGPQRGDNPATISREDQQAQIAGATLNFLDQFARPASAGCSSP